MTEQEPVQGSPKEPASSPPGPSRSPSELLSSMRPDRIRNLSGFWLLGLCNNFGYVVMLSAAHDILSPSSPPAENGTIPEPHENRSGKLIPECNPISTGAVLLADILPTLTVKLTAPFYIHNISYLVRVALVVIFGLVSFPVVALAHTVWINLFGVVLSSISSGFGELTFLTLSSHFEKDVVSTWSSGTGGAGVFGALSYVGLLAVGLTTRNTLLLMMLIPTTLALVYLFLLVKPSTVRHSAGTVQSENTPLLITNAGPSTSQSPLANFKHKLRLMVGIGDSTVHIFINGEHCNVVVQTIAVAVATEVVGLMPLLSFMIPLGLVYFAEYFINQGLQELLYFENAWLTIPEQYRWYQVLYQVGVFFSRSSVNCFHIQKLWILPILQMLNVVILLLQVFFKFIPSIWIMFVVILYEGILGGFAYVNTFYRITQEVNEENREFSMGVVSLADAMGIAVAGAVAIPVHDLICTL